MKAQSEGRQGTSSPTQAFFGHLQSCTSYVAGSIGAQDHVDDSGRGIYEQEGFLVTIADTSRSLMFSKSICNVFLNYLM